LSIHPETTSSSSSPSKQQQQPSQADTDTTVTTFATAATDTELPNMSHSPPSGVSLLRGVFAAVNENNPTRITDRLHISSASELSVSHHAHMTTSTMTATTTIRTPTNQRTLVSPAASPCTPAGETTYDMASVATDSSITTDLVYCDTEATEASQ
jgi:hypothetical protein